MSAPPASIQSAAAQLLAITAREWGVVLRSLPVRRQASGALALATRRVAANAIALRTVSTGRQAPVSAPRVFAAWAGAQESFC